MTSDRFERLHLSKLEDICTSWAISRDFLDGHFGKEILQSRRFVTTLDKVAKVHARDATLAAVNRASYTRRNNLSPHKGLDRTKSFQPADLDSAVIELVAAQSSVPSTTPATATQSNANLEDSQVSSDGTSVLMVVGPSTNPPETEAIDPHLDDSQSQPSDYIILAKRKSPEPPQGCEDRVKVGYSATSYMLLADFESACFTQ